MGEERDEFWLSHAQSDELVGHSCWDKVAGGSVMKRSSGARLELEANRYGGGVSAGHVGGR